MTCYILVTIETTKQHGNLNLFSFQCDGMWPVNMTSEPTGWPIKSQNTPNIMVDWHLFQALLIRFFTPVLQ